MVIGKKSLINNECLTMENYYNLIIESEINGQYKQMREYFNKFSREQKKDFLNYLEENNISNIALGDLI